MSPALIPILAAIDTFGALVGTGMTTFAEIFYNHAVSDGEIDHHERKYLRRLFRGFTFGITLVLLCNIALIVLEYLIPDAPTTVLLAPFWALQILALLILVIGWMLSKRAIPWWLGSSAVLSAWWILLLDDLGFFNAYSFLTIFFVFVLVTFILAGILTYLRMWMRKLPPLSIEPASNT